MNLQKLEYLISKEEGAKLDFKAELDITSQSGKKELAKDIIAIANSHGGRGYIIVGVRDKTKEILGMTSENLNEERIQQILGLRSNPPINIRVEYFMLEEKRVCVITIFRSYKQPHQMVQNGAFYIRRGSTTDVARREEIADMFQNGGLINNEQIPLLNMTIDIYSKELIKKYLERMNLKGQEENNTLLCTLGFMHYDKYEDKLCPTVGGILLFCENPQLYIPSLGVKIFDRTSGKKKIYQIDGNIFALIDKTMVHLEPHGAYYPIEAIEEALCNALLHRDYFDTTRSVVIHLRTDKVIISNPGSIFGNERLSNLYHQYNPRRRNGWLYEKVIQIDDQGRFLKQETGMSYIKKLCKNVGSVRYINMKKINLFKVILPGIKIEE
ncbi:MAG: putative DNA binding domain-containing protein [Clostridia bacterium]|nr:putative DNA binding domain-containing protein [Clostridia bacterium]